MGLSGEGVGSWPRTTSPLRLVWKRNDSQIQFYRVGETRDNGREWKQWAQGMVSAPASDRCELRGYLLQALQAMDQSLGSSFEGVLMLEYTLYLTFRKGIPKTKIWIRQNTIV